MFTTELGSSAIGKRDRAQIVDHTTAVKEPEETKDFQVEDQAGTPAFTPPEVHVDAHDPFALDLWSLGVSIYSIIFGTLPFYAATIHDVQKAIAEEEPTYPN